MRAHLHLALAVMLATLAGARGARAGGPLLATTARGELLSAMALHADGGPRLAPLTASVQAILALLLEPPAPFDPAAHLLAGARHFRAGRFTAALVEFRLVERAGSPPADLGLYLGPTLYKLGRLAEAVEAFSTLPGASSDPLADYYHGLAAYDLKLYLRARVAFTRVERSGGPKLGGSAARFLAEIERVFARPVGPGTVDAYLEWARQAIALGRPVLTRVYLEEARQLSALAGGARAAELRALEPAAR